MDGEKSTWGGGTGELTQLNHRSATGRFTTGDLKHRSVPGGNNFRKELGPGSSFSITLLPFCGQAFHQRSYYLLVLRCK